MLQNRYEHGGDAEHGVGAVGLAEFDHQSGVKQRHQYLGELLRHAAENGQGAPACVEEWHGGHVDIAVVHAKAIDAVVTVVDESTVMKEGSLGKASRT